MNNDPGQIITFYSYKGGTGRTMALANTACLLARKYTNDLNNSSDRVQVVAIDWDFEAPGLHRYFEPYTEDVEFYREAPGCLELFEELAKRKSEFAKHDYEGNRKLAIELLGRIRLERFLVKTSIPGLSIIKAGKLDSEDYAKRVSKFEWQDFFEATYGLFAGLTDFLRERFQFTLVDSRTGITDSSGICTMLLPDKLVVAFTPNRQSLTGVKNLVDKAIKYRRNSPDMRPLVVFPLASRIEMARPGLFEQWRFKGQADSLDNESSDGYQVLFERMFRENYRNESINLSEYFDEVQIQHVPDYAYGEPIAVELEASESRIFLRRSYEAFVERLVELESPWESLGVERAERALMKKIQEARQLIDGGKSALSIGYVLLEEVRATNVFTSLSECLLEIAGAAIQNEPASSIEFMQRLGDAVRSRSMTAPRIQGGEISPEPISLAEVAGFFERLGKLCIQARKTDMAEKFFVDSLACYEYAFGEGHPAVRSVLERLVESLSDVGKYQIAFHYASRAYEICNKFLGEQDLHTLRCKGVLGNILVRMGAYEEASKLLEQTLAAQKALLGEMHFDTLSSMNSLANMLGEVGDLSAAYKLQEHTLLVRKELLGETHPDTLNSMSNLAIVLGDMGDYEGARKLEEKVLAHRELVLGEMHPDTLSSMSNLAISLERLGDYVGALKLQEKALIAQKQVLSEWHPSILTSMKFLAVILGDLGDYEGARELQEKTLEIEKELHGDEHPDTLGCMNNLANTLNSMGDYMGARQLQETTLKLRIAELGERHSDTLSSLGNLANTLINLGDFVRARQLQETALEIQKDTLGELHPDTLATMNNLGNTLRIMRDYKGAFELQEKSLEMLKEVQGELHPDTLATMNNLALTLMAMGNYERARELQEKSLPILKVVRGEMHSITLSCLSGLATTLENLGELKRAQELIEETLAKREQVQEVPPIRIQRLIKQLSALLMKTGEKDRAFKLMSELMREVTVQPDLSVDSNNEIAGSVMK